MRQLDIFQNQPAAMRPMPEGRALPFPPESARPARNASTGHDQRGSRDTSRDAFVDHKETGKLGKQQQAVFSVLTRSGLAFTRAELAQHMGISGASICGRVKELLDLKIIVEDPRRPCTVTKKSAHPVRSA